MSTTATPPVPTATPTTTPPPLAPATGWPRPLRWTVDLFHTVNATGVFAGRRPMLIRGVLLEQGPMNDPHADAVEGATEVLRGLFAPGWRIRVQLPLRLGQDTDPFPDVAVLMGGWRDGAPTTAALVIEVSDTSVAFDLTTKAEVYATGGILDYWVLDLNARALHVFRDPRSLPNNLGAVAYQTHLTLDATQSVQPLAAPTAVVRVADLLP